MFSIDIFSPLRRTLYQSLYYVSSIFSLHTPELFFIGVEQLYEFFFCLGLHNAPAKFRSLPEAVKVMAGMGPHFPYRHILSLPGRQPFQVKFRHIQTFFRRRIREYGPIFQIRVDGFKDPGISPGRL